MNKKKRPIRQTRDCFFCQSGEDPDFKDVEGLRRFLSERGKIMSRERSGNCARHQRRLSREIKKARHLGLLPFTVKI